MVLRRKRESFRRLGDVDPRADVGVSAARARDLRLQVAWIAVAGERLAGRLRAVRVRRRIVEFAVEEAEWARELAGLVPQLAARLSAHDPGLGIRRYRVWTRDGASGPCDVPEAIEPWPVPDARDSEATGESSTASERPAIDIEDLARRYLRAR